MANYASSAEAGFFKSEFMQTIGSITLSRLKIPAMFFAENMAGGQQADAVILISDQLARLRVVTLEEQTLRDGWPEFARALRLKVSDVLVFRYKGNYVFKVTAFGADGEKLEHEDCEHDEGDIDGGNTTSGNRKSKLVGKEPVGQSSRPQKNAASGREYSGHSPRSQRITTTGNATLTPRGIRSHTNVAVEDYTSFVQFVTDSNIEKNQVYLPKRFVELNGLDDKDIGSITLTNNDGETWEAVVRVCTDGRLRIGGCWTVFCYENDLFPGHCYKFQLVENNEDTVIRLVGLNEDEELEAASPAARVQPSGSSGFRPPKAEGSSMYYSVPVRGQRRQPHRM